MCAVWPTVLTLNIFEHSMKNLRLQAFRIYQMRFYILFFEIFNVKMCPRLLEHCVFWMVFNAHEYHFIVVFNGSLFFNKYIPSIRDDWFSSKVMQPRYSWLDFDSVIYMIILPYKGKKLLPQQVFCWFAYQVFFYHISIWYLWSTVYADIELSYKKLFDNGDKNVQETKRISL